MKYIVKLYLLLFGICLWAIFVGRYILPFKYSFPYVEDFLSQQGPWWLWPFANFDGVHYLLIAAEGYVRDLYQAFFPLYPLVVRLVHLIFRTKSYLPAALLVSHAGFVVTIYYWHRLLQIDYKKDKVNQAMWLLIFFPTSFFLLNAYSESLFLALVFSFFYYLRKKRFWLAAILAGLASAVRVAGVFLVISWLIEFWLTKKKKKVNISFIGRSIIGSILSLGGFFLYCLFLYQRFSDPLKFIRVQEAFGASRTPDKLVLLYQVFYRYIKMLLTVDRTNPIFFAVVLEFSLSLLFLGLILTGIFVKKYKVRLSYSIFSLLVFLLPTLTGTLSSMPRYVLTCFSGFMVLAQIKNKIAYKLVLGISVGLLAACSILFYRGYWIA